MSVGSCPTLLVEGEVHQHINPSAKCISTPGLTFYAKHGRKHKPGWCECVFYSTCRVELSHIWDWGVTIGIRADPRGYTGRVRASDTGIWRMARVDPCVVTRHGICAGTRRVDDVC